MRGGALAVALLVAAAACTSGTETTETLRIYTSVTQGTVDSVVAGFEEENPDAEVEVFRAPTGELTARIATELREGGLQADLLWLTDPLSAQQYESDGLLRELSSPAVDEIPGEFRTAATVGTRILNLVIVASDDLVDPPSDWADLASVQGVVAVPDPGFAGSAFAALGFFALEPGFGMGFYRSLRDNGAVEVRSPGDVVNGVAEGLYAAGITLDMTARAAVEDGSPISLVWPDSGAIALYSPIAVVTRSDSRFAERFVDYVLGDDAQQRIADTGWEPISEEVDWPHPGDRRTIDWTRAFDRQEELLDQYEQAFGN